MGDGTPLGAVGGRIGDTRGMLGPANGLEIGLPDPVGGLLGPA